MILIDANLLLYAYNPSFPLHRPARRWLEDAFSGSDLVRLGWLTIVAFLRIGTNARAFEHPLTTNEAVRIVEEWIAQPTIDLLGPGERHWEIFAELLTATQARGPVVTDAHLAALAIEHGATLCTTDRDFTRFPRLRTLNPLAPRT